MASFTLSIFLRLKVNTLKKFQRRQFGPAKILKSKFRQNKKNFLTWQGLDRIEKNFFMNCQGIDI
jgi:hypothetical protein